MLPATKIAGIGLVTPLGRSVNETWTTLLAGRCITDHTSLPATVHLGFSRVASLAIEAAEQAIREAGWGLLTDHEDTAVIVGTSKGPIESWIERAPPLSETSDNQNHPAGRLNFGFSEMTDDIARHTSFTDGPRLTLSAACASGLHALIRGCMMIQSGRAKRALVVAAEASVHPLFLASFKRLGVLPPAGQLCRPFDQNRQGFLMSDASAAICLEASSDPGVYVDRYALGGDATHLTGSKSDGAVLKYLVNQAISPVTSKKSTSPTISSTSDNLCYVKLDHGGLDGGANSPKSPVQMELERENRGSEDMSAAPGIARRGPVAAASTLDLIHAHGTGTELNDATELGVLDHLGLSSKPVLYSHKGAIGHSLGASGLVSVVINCLCHRTGRVPGNVNTPDPMPHSGVIISNAALDRRIDRSMVISSGFGGPTAIVSLRTRS